MDIYLPPNFCPNFFVWKNDFSKVPYLPTVWTYVQNSVDFWNPLLYCGSSPVCLTLIHTLDTDPPTSPLPKTTLPPTLAPNELL